MLPRGEAIRIKPAPRRAAGPDLMQAFVGGEGAFGVITAAYLRVHRPPRARQIVGAWFPGPAPALACLASLLADSVRPAAARVVRPGPAWATESLRGEAALVLTFEGHTMVVDQFVAMARERIAEAEGSEAGEDDPVCTRDPVDLPSETARALERVEAAGRWSDLLALDREAAVGATTWSAASNALPKAVWATWALLEPEKRLSDVRRPPSVRRASPPRASRPAYRGRKALPRHSCVLPTERCARGWNRSARCGPSGILNPHLAWSDFPSTWSGRGRTENEERRTRDELRRRSRLAPLHPARTLREASSPGTWAARRGA